MCDFLKLNRLYLFLKRRCVFWSVILRYNNKLIIQCMRFIGLDVFLPFCVFVTSKNTVYFVHNIVMNDHNMFVYFLVVLLEEREDNLVEYKTLRKERETRVRKQKWKVSCVYYAASWCYVFVDLKITVIK